MKKTCFPISLMPVLILIVCKFTINVKTTLKGVIFLNLDKTVVLNSTQRRKNRKVKLLNKKIKGSTKEFYSFILPCRYFIRD